MAPLTAANTHMYTYIYTHTCICMCVYICIHMYTHRYIDIYTYIYLHIYIYIYIYIHVGTDFHRSVIRALCCGPNSEITWVGNLNWDFGLIWIGTEEFGFLDLVDCGGLAWKLSYEVQCMGTNVHSPKKKSEWWQIFEIWHSTRSTKVNYQMYQRKVRLWPMGESCDSKTPLLRRPDPRRSLVPPRRRLKFKTCLQPQNSSTQSQYFPRSRNESPTKWCDRFFLILFPQ